MRDDASDLPVERASQFARLALGCLTREYPNKLDHVINDASELKSPQALHPSFYGCFDWHSSVHGHWMLVRLLRVLPDLPEAERIRLTLDTHLSTERLSVELAYLGQRNRQSFERTYGWAWLLKFAEELATWEDADAQRWFASLKPLADAFALRFREFLPKQAYPIRTGVHPNTAFALGFALDYARATGEDALESTLLERSLAYFKNDVRYPAAWEPSGEDFFSPALMEADLMGRVLSRKEFASWLSEFLPELSVTEPKALLEPVIVTDRTDPKLVHLDGLNLSRAWCMRTIALHLPEEDGARSTLVAAAGRHATAGLSHVASGNYVGEHWLATFAVYLLSGAGQGRGCD